MRILLPLVLVVACSEQGLNAHVDLGDGAGEDEPPPSDDEPTDDDEDDEDDDNSADWLDEPPAASAPVYAHSDLALYEIDLGSGEPMYIGHFHTEQGDALDDFVDIAIDLDGNLYGGTWSSLYRIDPDTAEVTYVCSPDQAQLVGMTFTSNGDLVGAGGSSVHFIDVDDCFDEALVPSSSYQNSGDLVGLPDGYLYWTVQGGSSDQLVRIDPDTGDLLLVGTTTGASGLWGMAFYDEELWGFSSNGAIVKIDPYTAGTTPFASTTVSWWGATTNPVTW